MVLGNAKEIETKTAHRIKNEIFMFFFKKMTYEKKRVKSQLFLIQFNPFLVKT